MDEYRTNGQRFPEHKTGEEWRQLFSESGAIVYEGFTWHGKPYGSGTAYFENGNKYQEGIFGIKGLLIGREYYANGAVRFEGAYHVNTGYGPNYPDIGRVYNEQGKLLFKGQLRFKTSGLGWPLECINVAFGRVSQETQPDVPCLAWYEVYPTESSRDEEARVFGDM